MKNSIHIEPIVKAEKADEWSRLFERYGLAETAWIGADGIFSFALDGNDAFAGATENTKTFFIFSDTLFGTASEDGRKALREAMPNHTSAILEGNKPDAAKRRFVWGKGGSCTLNLRDLDDNEKKNLLAHTFFRHANTENLFSLSSAFAFSLFFVSLASDLVTFHNFDKVEAIRTLSSEIEYSEENTDRLLEVFDT